MLDRMIGWSIRDRILVVLATLVMAGEGARAAWIAPVDAIPDLSENQVIVHAEWAGHGPGVSMKMDHQTPFGWFWTTPGRIGRFVRYHSTECPAQPRIFGS